MDVLSDVLSKVKLSSVVYFKSDFSEPWGMDIPKGPFAQFHIVTKGQCVLKTKGKSIQLFTGDIVVFPFGASHWLANNENSKLYQGEDVVKAILSGKSLFEGDKLSTTLVCGHFEFDKNLDHPFIKELPSIIHIDDTDLKQYSWLKNITDLVIEEAEKEQSGSGVIINKLGEILFVHTLRAFILKSKSVNGFIAAIQDERISKVLKEIHTSPKNDWQLESLAQIAGMSRTSFINKFKVLIGNTPFNYLTQWRLLYAKELLKESNKSVGEIAEEVGYQSEAAFNRVFKKNVKQTPLKFRQKTLIS
ncbi:AraC family transcriptional regulator [Flagellimonas sp. CMM7]|uniref:AraC family transcriptional regulator n=1 Tax=Flagellimonas sp. CMM7 TaxID=2654676 RepID=UPI0013D34185|nr:AraC family transcriptional regulator [Flagellimonas sp. CMM7]UII79023.1 AraC family transcriptional regulator [Flagellimonas sp. CMM7]